MNKLLIGTFFSATLLFSASFESGIKNLNAGFEKKAYETFFLAAKSGDTDAQMILGEMYLDGIGVEVDHDKAFFWLSKAAASGDPEAQYHLAFMYENGIKVAKNMTRAVKWYTEAALQGDILSQYNLAIIYKEGRGEVEKDMQKAFKWLYLVQEAREKMDFVASAK